MLFFALIIIKMSLFVANISKNVMISELEDAFDAFGKCKVRQNVSKAIKN